MAPLLPNEGLRGAAPIIIDRGKGVYLYDKNGKEYIDIVSSWWCNLLGHCNPKINESIKAQLDKLEHVIFANLSHEPAIRLCEQLSEIIPEGLTKFNFSDNGSAAIECSLKMAFQYAYQTGHTKKTKFMCLTEGYHGETIGALSRGKHGFICQNLQAHAYGRDPHRGSRLLPLSLRQEQRQLLL